MITKPLLAGTIELDKITFPKIASPKLDGIRCLIVNGKALSRSFKPIANVYTRTKLEEAFKDFRGVLDGELILKGKEFNEISSAIMSFDGEPDFTFVVFDYLRELSIPFVERLGELEKLTLPERCEMINNSVMYSLDEMLNYERIMLKQGYEGIMLRSPEGKYKQGRSTPKEQSLLKVKRFTDSEAIIYDMIEQMENQNEIEVNELGNNFRSKHKENMVGKNTMGALMVREMGTGIEFKVASGFTDAMRKQMWENKDQYLDKIVKFKYQEHGTLDKPRIPVFIGFRSKEDM